MVDIIVFLCVVVLVLVVPLYLIVYALIHYRKLEEKRKQRLATIHGQTEKSRASCMEKELAHKRSTSIAKVRYLGEGDGVLKRGGLSGAMLGAFFAGPIGALVGAILPKTEEETYRFEIKYVDGRVEIKDIHPNNREFKKLMDIANRDFQ